MSDTEVKKVEGDGTQEISENADSSVAKEDVNIENVAEDEAKQEQATENIENQPLEDNQSEVPASNENIETREEDQNILPEDTEIPPSTNDSEMEKPNEPEADSVIETNDNDALSDTETASVHIEVEAATEIDIHPLDELTDQQVLELVAEMELENRQLELENTLFESFLKENDPSLLEGMDEIMAYVFKAAAGDDVSSAASTTTADRCSRSMDRQRLRLDSYTSITSIAEGKGPKINLSQKTDMVMRAMEESQTSLQHFLKKSHIIKRNLKSELEEFSIREVEIKEAMDIFEFNVVTQGFDKLTQRIPAEKFIRYMEEWLKSAQLQIEKLRLRIATLKLQYKKVSQQLIQRQELGENVHAVDFDQLEIENKHFIEKIEQKNIHLVELKKMNGGANLVLSTHKKYLQKQQEDCNMLKEQIEEQNRLIHETEIECANAEEELKEVCEKYEQCKNLKSQYTVPDVMEYVRLKEKLHELRKNIKIWTRRRKIQDIALNTCLREMKNMTGNSNIDPSWFQDDNSLDSRASSELLL